MSRETSKRRASRSIPREYREYREYRTSRPGLRPTPREVASAVSAARRQTPYHRDGKRMPETPVPETLETPNEFVPRRATESRTRGRAPSARTGVRSRLARRARAFARVFAPPPFVPRVSPRRAPRRRRFRSFDAHGRTRRFFATLRQRGEASSSVTSSVTRPTRLHPRTPPIRRESFARETRTIDVDAFGRVGFRARRTRGVRRTRGILFARGSPPTPPPR